MPQSIRDVDATMRKLEHEEAVRKWSGKYRAASNDNEPAMGPPRVEVRPVYPARDKLLRAQPVAAAYLAGRVLIPSDAPWAAELIGELCALAGVGDVHDDQVDALAHLWNGLFRDSGNQGLGGIMTADDFPRYLDDTLPRRRRGRGSVKFAVARRARSVAVTHEPPRTSPSPPRATSSTSRRRSSSRTRLRGGSEAARARRRRVLRSVRDGPRALLEASRGRAAYVGGDDVPDHVRIEVGDCVPDHLGHTDRSA